MKCMRKERGKMTDRFALYMQKLGKSQNTMATYIRNIRQYFEWCEFSFGNAPPQLYRANVLEYISYMRNLKGYSPKSVNNHLSALRCLNEFLIAEGTQTETVILKTGANEIMPLSPCMLIRGFGERSVSVYYWNRWTWYRKRFVL